MADPTGVRTFILLDEQQVNFVRTLQRLAKKASGTKRQPSVHSVIRGVLMDYKRMLETSSSPDFLTAYHRVRDKRRAPKHPKRKGVFAGEPFVVESI